MHHHGPWLLPELAGTSIEPLQTGGDGAVALPTNPPVNVALESPDADVVATVWDLARSAILRFPQNIFWDLAALTHHLQAQVSRAEDRTDFLRRYHDAAERVIDLYGSPPASAPGVGPRYLHDFLYGLCWAKWVVQQPDNASTGPYDLAFLEHLREAAEERAAVPSGAELATASEGWQYRRPFTVSRDPAAERRALSQMAAANLLPVRAWDPHDTPDWRRPYHPSRLDLLAGRQDPVG